jgi:hypothetical protein
VFIPPDADSEIAQFMLTPTRIGRLPVLIELQWEDALRGSRSLRTECVAEVTNLRTRTEMNVVRVPLDLGAGDNERAEVAMLLFTAGASLAGGIARAPQPNAPAESTMLFGSGKGKPFPAGPLQGSQLEDIPEEPGSPTPVFSIPSQPALPSPANAPPRSWEPQAPPFPAGPKIAEPPPPAPKAQPRELKAWNAKPSYLPLVIILNVSLFLAILLIVYFMVKR